MTDRAEDPWTLMRSQWCDHADCPHEHHVTLTVLDGLGLDVASADLYGAGDPRAEQFARIVAAVNAHDDLLAQRAALLDAADFTLRCIEHPHPGPGERAADRTVAEEKLRVAIAFALGNKDAAESLARRPS